MQIVTKIGQEWMDILTSDTIDFKSKKVTKQRRTLYINKSFNTARNFNNYNV